MNSFILYSIELTAGLAIFYLTYYLFFYKETHFNLIRIYLLTTVIIACIMPKLNFTYNSSDNNFLSAEIITSIARYKQTINSKIETLTKTSNSTNQNNLNKTTYINSKQIVSKHCEKNEIPIKTNAANKVNTFSIIHNDNYFYNIDFETLLLVSYLAGLCFFMLRFAFNILHITKYVLQSKIEKTHGNKIVWVKKEIPPFSFMNYIFISSNTRAKPELSNIIIHENIHIKQLHSFDILLIELLMIFQWFNPIVWLYKHAMKRNHEFLADHGVINKGVDPRDYQYALLNHILLRNKFEIVSNYSYHDLKIRMAMLTRKRSSGFSLLKLIFLFPFIIFLCLAFSINITTQYDINNTKKGNKKLSTVFFNPIGNITPSHTVSIKTTANFQNIKNKTKNSIYKNQFIEIDNCTLTELNEECLQGINCSLLTMRNGITYILNDSIPYTGKCFSYYDTNEKGTTGSYVNGIESDKWIFWYKNGQKKMEYQVNNGHKNGNYYAWYKNGKLRIDARYIMGEIDELYKCWHENGTLKKESCFINGVPYDSMVYDENGNPDILL